MTLTELIYDLQTKPLVETPLKISGSLKAREMMFQIILHTYPEETAPNWLRLLIMRN